MEGYHDGGFGGRRGGAKGGHGAKKEMGRGRNGLDWWGSGARADAELKIFRRETGTPQVAVARHPPLNQDASRSRRSTWVGRSYRPSGPTGVARNGTWRRVARPSPVPSKHDHANPTNTTACQRVAHLNWPAGGRWRSPPPATLPVLSPSPAQHPPPCGKAHARRRVAGPAPASAARVADAGVGAVHPIFDKIRRAPSMP